jgi:4-hydroxy-tetrahydrodipicolinate synthase
LARNGRQDVGGLFTALITPFDEKGKVSVESISKLVKFQVSKGTDGIFPCGSTGLGPMLGLDERKEVAQTVIDSAARKVPVVIQVGCADTASTVELAKHAEKAGATAVASLTPYYYKPGEKAIAKHFEEISASVEIPVFAYNIPHFTGNPLTPGAVASLAKSGMIDGIKDSSRDFLHLIDLVNGVPEDFVVMNGSEEYGLFAIMSGADGLVSGAASAIPELFGRLVGAEKKGDIKDALMAQRTVQKVKDLVKSAPIPAYYEILRERGIDCGAPRRPFLPLAKEDSVRLIKDIKELRLV